MGKINKIILNQKFLLRETWSKITMTKISADIGDLDVKYMNLIYAGLPAKKVALKLPTKCEIEVFLEAANSQIKKLFQAAEFRENIIIFKYEKEELEGLGSVNQLAENSVIFIYDPNYMEKLFMEILTRTNLKYLAPSLSFLQIYNITIFRSYLVKETERVRIINQLALLSGRMLPNIEYDLGILMKELKNLEN